jgi:hypothetical protein
MELSCVLKVTDGYSQEKTTCLFNFIVFMIILQIYFLISGSGKAIRKLSGKLQITDALDKMGASIVKPSGMLIT